MKKLIVDLDDVLCKNGFIRMINEFLGKEYAAEDANSYFINDLIPKESIQKWVEFFNKRNVYDYVDLLEDSQEVMKKLNECYDIYIASAYVFRDAPQVSGKTLNDKYNFLCDNFPFLDPRKFIFISNKELLEADIRIDDSINKLTGNADKKLLFTAYHNTNISKQELQKQGITRVNNWKEIANILL